MNDRARHSLLALLAGALPLAAQAPAAPTLSLRAAAALAADHSPDLAASQAAAQSSAASARLAGDAFRPEASATTTPGVSRGLPVDVLGAVPAIAGVEVHQVFYDPRRRSEAIAAQAEALNGKSAFERMRLDAARSAADAYARCWADNALAAAAARRLTAREAARTRIAALLSSGRTTELELGKADLAISRAKLRQLDSQTERELDLLTLRRLTGLGAGGELRLGEDPLSGLPESGAGDPVLAAQTNDPEIRAASQSIALLEQAQKLIRGIPLPIVAAEAQYYRLSRANGIDQFYRMFRSDDWSIALSVTYPLWSAGRQRDYAARAQANLDRSVGQREARRSLVAFEAERAGITVSNAAASAQVARQARQLAADAAQQTHLLIDANRADPAELEERDAELADAEDEAAHAELRLFQARLELLVLRGELARALLPTSTGEDAR